MANKTNKQKKNTIYFFVKFYFYLLLLIFTSIVLLDSHVVSFPKCTEQSQLLDWSFHSGKATVSHKTGSALFVLINRQLITNNIIKYWEKLR